MSNLGYFGADRLVGGDADGDADHDAVALPGRVLGLLLRDQPCPASRHVAETPGTRWCAGPSPRAGCHRVGQVSVRPSCPHVVHAWPFESQPWWSKQWRYAPPVSQVRVGVCAKAGAAARANANATRRLIAPAPPA